MVLYCPYCMGQIQAGELCPVCGRHASLYVPSSHHLPPGSLLHKRYRIGRVLREEDFSLTYLVLDQLLDRRFMIEECFPRGFVHRDASEGPAVAGWPGEKGRIFEKTRMHLLQDAQAMKGIGNAPGMVKIFDAFSDNHTTYIVMEYLDGETMGQQLERHCLMPGHILLPQMEPVLRAVKLLHGKGIIHCNIRPDSIMLLKNQAKLFGTARNLNVMRDITLTSKIEFSIPELNAGYALGPWTDTYMVCSTLYQDLTGINPAVVNRRSSGQSELQPPSQLGASLKMKQELAIMKGLSIRPEDRWQTMDELYDALYKYRRENASQRGTGYGGPVSDRPASFRIDASGEPPAEGSEKNSAKPRGRLIAVLAAALALLLVFILLGREKRALPASETEKLPSASPAGSPQGSFGHGFAWSLSGGVLTVSGTGEMPDFPKSNTKNGSAPWLEYREELQTVVLLNGITSIGENAFRDCEHLTGVTIPDSVQKIGSFAFCRCAMLESVTLPAGVTELGSFTFYGCSRLKEVSLPPGLTGIGNETFYHCDALETIDIPDGVRRIGSSAFARCAGLKSVTIPGSVTEIGSSAFAACTKLKSAGMREGLTVIRDAAFLGCRALEELSLPKSVSRIGSRAFSDCRSLREVFYGGTREEWKRIAIDEGNEALAEASIHYAG